MLFTKMGVHKYNTKVYIVGTHNHKTYCVIVIIVAEVSVNVVSVCDNHCATASPALASRNFSCFSL